MGRSLKFIAPLGVLAVGFLALTLPSVGQPEQGQTNATTNRSLIETAPKQQPAPEATPDFSKSTWDLPVDADKTKNPVEATAESVASGKELFLGKKGNCVFCHGETGAGNEENLPKLRRKPADLSDKQRMKAMPDGEIFWKITRGIPGIMPGREKQLTEEERWNVVNFVRTLQKDKTEVVN
jgi:mono/diheme cytochrome c family protein